MTKDHSYLITFNIKNNIIDNLSLQLYKYKYKYKDEKLTKFTVIDEKHFKIKLDIDEIFEGEIVSKFDEKNIDELNDLINNFCDKIKSYL